MVDELAVTNEIWRRWDEMKIKPPFEWYQLRVRVEEAIKEGRKPEEIVQAFMRKYGKSPEKLPEEVEKIPLLYTQTIQQEISAAIAEEKEAIDDYAQLENKLRQAGLSSQADIVNEIKTDEMDHKVKFEAMLKGEYPPMTKPATFYFETKGDCDRARDLLHRFTNFYFPYGPDFSLTVIDDPDYMLELLAGEGFDTSKILVKR